MAREFSTGASQYIQIDQAVVSGVPLTLACWFNVTNITAGHCLMNLCDKDVPDQQYQLDAEGTVVGDPVQYYRRAGASTSLNTTSGYSANTWHHACAVSAATNDARVYIDGGSKNTSNADFNPANLDRTCIGRAGDSTPWGYVDGRVAEAAVWNAALTDAEVAILAAGYPPPFVRPQNLVAYWPLIRDTDDDIVGGYSMTPFNGPTVGTHPPVFYPTAATTFPAPVYTPYVPGTPAVTGPLTWTVAPSVPSSFQDLGLSVAYADPLVKSPRAAYLGELRTEVGEYEHETAAIGGYLNARFTLAGDMVDVNDWYEHGLGRDIRVSGPHLGTVWEGFVNTVSIAAGQYAATVGPLVEISNRVYVVYSQRDTTVDPPTVIPGVITTIAQDADSQALHGIWEKQVTGGETDQTGAERTRDSWLREHKDPVADEPRVVMEAGGEVSVQVECLGNYAWLLAYPYQDVAGSGTVTCQTKVLAVLAADPNGIFSADVTHVGYNPALAPRYENSGSPGWEVMKALVALGDANDNRWLFGVYEGRRAHYERVPTAVAYQHRLSDPAQRIEWVGGGGLYPWDVEPGQWLYLPDFLTGRGQPERAADRRSDPRFIFVESVLFRAPFTVEVTGTRVGKLAQILAKQGIGGTGG